MIKDWLAIAQELLDPSQIEDLLRREVERLAPERCGDISSRFAQMTDAEIEEELSARNWSGAFK